MERCAEPDGKNRIDHPKVSVVLPVYGAEKYLDQCLQSFIRQTLQEIEIILVDDGSKDRSGEICERFAQKDERIIVIHQENRGAAGARNTGLKKARGKWVTFADPDDYVEPDYCLAAYRNGERTGADIVWFDGWREKETQAGVRSKDWVHADHSMQFTDRQNILNLQCAVLFQHMSPYQKASSLAAPWDKLYRRTFLELNNLRFPESLRVLDDMVFNFMAFHKAVHISYLHRRLYHYCDHRLSITNSYHPERRQQDQMVFRYLRKLIERQIREMEEDATISEVYKRRAIHKLRTAYYARVVKSTGILVKNYLCSLLQS